MTWPQGRGCWAAAGYAAPAEADFAFHLPQILPMSTGMPSQSQTLDESAVRRAYARWAKHYDAIVGPVTDKGRAMAVAAANRRVATGDVQVLEVGVGSGLSLPGYDRRARVTGIDLSQEMLALAHARVRAEALGHVEALEEMDAAAMGYPDAAFDTCVAMYVMSVVPDPARVLNELARVTKPGGEVIVVNHFASHDGWLRWIEQKLERVAALLGWHPAFPREAVLAHPALELVEERKVGLLGIFTLMRFARVRPDPKPSSLPVS